MAQKDFYAVLGVSASATADELKKQYRRRAKQYHPDSNKGDPKSADRFKEISEAYNVLGDAEKRKQYDDMKRLGAFGDFAQRRGGGFGGARPGGPGGPGAPGGTGTSGGFRFEDVDIGGLGGLGDLFSSMFGGGAANARGRQAGPERGQSIEATLNIPFRVAALGGKVPVQLEVNEECQTCHGSVAAPGATMKTCPECTGRGNVTFCQRGFAVS